MKLEDLWPMLINEKLEKCTLPVMGGLKVGDRKSKSLEGRSGIVKTIPCDTNIIELFEACLCLYDQ